MLSEQLGHKSHPQCVNQVTSTIIQPCLQILSKRNGGKVLQTSKAQPAPLTFPHTRQVPRLQRLVSARSCCSTRTTAPACQLASNHCVVLPPLNPPVSSCRAVSAYILEGSNYLLLAMTTSKAMEKRDAQLCTVLNHHLKSV